TSPDYARRVVKPVNGAAASLPWRYLARIRLFFASCAISTTQRASSSGVMYTPNRPRGPFLRPYQPPSGFSAERPHASTDPSGAGFFSAAPPSGTQSHLGLSIPLKASV